MSEQKTKNNNHANWKHRLSDRLCVCIYVTQNCDERYFHKAKQKWCVQLKPLSSFGFEKEIYVGILFRLFWALQILFLIVNQSVQRRIGIRSLIVSLPSWNRRPTRKSSICATFFSMLLSI